MSILCSMVGASFVTAAAEILRSKKGIQAVGNAQVDTAQSKFGGASLLLDGTGDYLTFNAGNAGDFEFTAGEDFTMECWFRVNSFPQFCGIMALGNARGAASQEAVIYIENSSGTPNGPGLRFALNYGSPVGLFNTSATYVLSTNTWYHCAITRSGTTWKLFQNGTEIATATATATAGVSGVGGKIGSFSDATLQYNGWIDEVRISNTARYTANFTPSTTPFVNDNNTLLLIHCDGTDATTSFEDDNGVRAPIGITAVGSNVTVNTTQSNFGGSSVYFNGTNGGAANYLSGLWSDANIQTITNIPNYTNYTVEYWIRIPSSPGFTNLQDGDTPASVGIGLQNPIDYPFSWSFGPLNAGTVRFSYLYNSSYSNYGSITSSTTLSANIWYHLAFVKTGTGIKIYIDGTERASGTLTGTMWIQNHGLTMGSYYRARPNIWMDEIRISSTNRYTANFTPPTAPFVNDANTLLLLHCDGTNASTVFRDDNGEGRTSNGIRAIGNAQISTAQSKFGVSSAYFDGTDDYLVANGNFSMSGDFTVECWFRANRVTGAQILMTIGNEATERATVFLDGNVLKYDTFSGGTPDITCSGTISTGVWYHVAAVRSGSTITVYRDGTSVGTGTKTGTVGNATNAYFGADSNSVSDYQGWIDEIRYSNTARYTANFTPSTTPFQNDSNTLLLLHMDGTNASTTFIDDNGKRPV